jgi:hypothetical protein
MEKKRNACKLLVGKPEGKRPLGRPRHWLVGNIMIDLEEIGWGGMEWTGLPQDMHKRRALVNAAMNIRVM